MKFSIGTMVLFFSLFAVPVSAEEQALNFEDETIRINYSLGYQIGGDFKRQGVEMLNRRCRSPRFFRPWSN